MKEIRTSEMRTKGASRRTALSLSGEQKAKLLFWIKDNKAACFSTASFELARVAGEALGFSISPSSILWARNSVHPEMRRCLGPRGSSQPAVIAKLEERVSALEDMVAKLSRDLGIET